MSNIHDQPSLANSFFSNLVIKDSEIHSLEIEKPNIEIIGLTLQMENVKISNIIMNNTEFIQVSSHGELFAKNVTFKGSDSFLFNFLNSKASLETINFMNVDNSESLIKVLDCDNILFNNIILLNASVTSDNFISITKSSHINIQNINVSDLNRVLFKIEESNVSQVINFTTTNSSQTFNIRESVISSIEDSHFTNNLKGDILAGGVLNLFNSEVAITNSTFTNNTAVRGGAISFKCSSIMRCKLNINNTQFNNNVASKEGGAIYYDYMFPSTFNVTFLNNSAPYGPDFASYPVRIGRVSSMKNDNISLNDVASGIVISDQLELALIDNDDQVMVLDSASQLIILSKDPNVSNIGGINTALLKNGVANFDSLSATSEPGSTNVQFKISTEAFDQHKLQAVFNITETSKDLNINFRFCKPGEQILNNQCHE